jgi:hypothetical protein
MNRFVRRFLINFIITSDSQTFNQTVEYCLCIELIKILHTINVNCNAIENLSFSIDTCHDEDLACGTPRVM